MSIQPLSIREAVGKGYSGFGVIVRLENRFKIFLLLAGLVLAGFFAWLVLLPAPKPDPLPNPNGYDDFVAAGQMVKGGTILGCAPLQQHRIFVSWNRAALARGRLGIAKECRVPVEYSETWEAEHFGQILVNRDLEETIRTEGELADLDNRPEEAAECFLTMMKIGVELDRGGLMDDAQCAFICEKEAELLLESDIPKLDLQQSRKCIEQLENIESKIEPSASILHRERAWLRNQLGSFAGIKEFVNACIAEHTLAPVRRTNSGIVHLLDERVTSVRDLEAEFAAHAFALERGHHPTNWSEVAPAYLKEAPEVPFNPGATNWFNSRAGRR